jgi:hypothetical protein
MNAMDRRLAYLPTALRPRYGTEGQGRMIEEAWETARRCFACAGACWQSIATWLDHQEPLPDRLLVVIDCAEICEIAAHSLMRGSPEAPRIAALAGELCELTAKVAEDEPELAGCLEAALRCARSCRSFGEAA